MLPPQARTILKHRKVLFILLAWWEIATFCSSSTHVLEQRKKSKEAFKQAIKERIMLPLQARKI
jgi:hypothetical protein